MHHQRQQQHPADGNGPAQQGSWSVGHNGRGTHEKTSALGDNTSDEKRNAKKQQFCFQTSFDSKVALRFALWHPDSHFKVDSMSFHRFWQSSSSEMAS